MKKIPLVIFLHFYQPPNQQEDILERIVFESYRPVLKIFSKKREATATFNFPAGLAQLLVKKGFGDVVGQLKKLVQRDQIELTGSAAYHAFLPLLPVAEIKRQILLNEEGLAKFFGKTHKRYGFFPPELAFSNKLAKVVEDFGFKWMVIPMVSLGPEIPSFTTLYRLSGGNLYLFPRHKWASAAILSGIVRNKKSFLDWIKNEQPRGYLLAIMDAETFGHHRPGLENFLAEIINSAEFELLKVSNLFERLDRTRQIQPREASWSNEEQDFWLDRERKVVAVNPFLLWKDSKNPIHALQWKLTALAIRSVRNFELRIKNGELKKKIQHGGRASLHSPSLTWLRSAEFNIYNSGRKFLGKLTKDEKQWLKARELLDKALASDQYWWASAKPWWSLEMVEAGAWQLVQVVKTVAGFKSKSARQAEKLYGKITDQAFGWQRSGVIRKMHAKLSATVTMPQFRQRTPKEWYNQIILEFEDEMRKAARDQEFEKAIKWRDAIFKLNSGADVFDVLHVVDELAAVRKIPSLKPFLGHRNGEISKFAKKNLQPLTKKEITLGKNRLRQQGFKV